MTDVMPLYRADPQGWLGHHAALRQLARHLGVDKETAALRRAEAEHGPAVGGPAKRAS